MKRAILFPAAISLILVPITLSSAVPYGPPSSTNPRASASLNGSHGEKVSFGEGCFGRTDIPHESQHVPLTVNVEAITECPNQEVYVTTTISRHGWWIFPDTKSVSAHGFQKVSVNVALPCKWKRGQPPILYVAKSTHRDSVGEYAPTGRVAEIRC